MTEIKKFSEIVEPNGKTVKENNMELKHNIPLGSLVRAKVTLFLNTHRDEDSFLEGEVLLYVTLHGRDCDGTPLYGLCDSPIKYPEQSFDRHWLQVNAFSKFLNFGYSEESLTPTGESVELFDHVADYLGV